MDYFNMVSLVLTLVGVGAAIWAVHQNTDINNKQMNMQVFLAYTERYKEIMCGLPSDALDNKPTPNNDLPSESPELTDGVMHYLNLVSEEYYLWQRGYLDNAVWTIWEGEIQRTLRLPLIRREWAKLRKEYETFKDFQQYVDTYAS